MQTRKIALHRNSLIAIVMTLLVLGSALAIAGNSTAISPQVEKVNYNALYYLGGSTYGPANSTLTTVTVTTLNGVYVASNTGATGNFTLPYGSYVFSTSPYEAVSNGAPIIANGVSQIVNVTSSTSQPVRVNIPIYQADKAIVHIMNISYDTSAAVTFVTPQGYTFAKGTVNYTNYNLTENLPVGNFYVNTVYGGKTYSNLINNNPAQSSVNVILNKTNFFGFVNSNATGNTISNFNIVDLNLTTNTYTVLSFTNGYYQVDKLNAPNNVYTLEANGYDPLNITNNAPGEHSFKLNESSSNIYYNYALASNPKYLNLTVDYSIGNSTTISFLSNSSVGSLYWQYKLDKLSTPAAQSSLNATLKEMFGQYTDNSFVVSGYNYNATGTYGKIISESLGPNGFTAKVNFTFQNPDIKASDISNGFSVKLYAQGTQYMPGSLYSVYNLTYTVANVSLSSPANVASKFISPVSLKPQATSGFLTLTFKKVLSPQVTASEIQLYWNNTNPTNYLLGSNSTSAAFIVPENMPISFNLSNAFYNPVTGTSNYQDSIYYEWNVNGQSSGQLTGSAGYNYTYTNGFTKFGNYTVSVTFESSAGARNTTTFNVFAYNATPTSKLNVTYSAQTLFPTATVSNTVNITVPQSKVVQFSGYGSYLNIPNTSYKAPLIYNWYFPGYTNSAMNVTQTFNTPYIANKQLITGYLNVSSAVGKITSTMLLINVTDTTPPSAQLTVQNTNHTTIAQPIAGQTAIFTANGSSDKYFGTDLYYNWSIVYANGTNVPAGSSTYQLLGNSTNQSYIMVKFYTLSSLIVSLKVTNKANVSAYSNFTTSMVVVSPRLVVQNVYFPTQPSQGAKATVYLNISNNGTVDANSFYIIAIVNGKIVNNQSYGPLPVGTTKQFEFNFTSPSQGNVQVEFEAINASQPSFFAKNGALTVTQKVSPPSYQTPLIVGGVILIIIVIGAVYYRLSSRGTAKPKETKKQTPARKTEEKKK